MQRLNPRASMVVSLVVTAAISMAVGWWFNEHMGEQVRGWYARLRWATEAEGVQTRERIDKLESTVMEALNDLSEVIPRVLASPETQLTLEPAATNEQRAVLRAGGSSAGTLAQRVGVISETLGRLTLIDDSTRLALEGLRRRYAETMSPIVAAFEEARRATGVDRLSELTIQVPSTGTVIPHVPFDLDAVYRRPSLSPPAVRTTPPSDRPPD